MYVLVYVNFTMAALCKLFEYPVGSQRATPETTSVLEVGATTAAAGAAETGAAETGAAVVKPAPKHARAAAPTVAFFTRDII